MPTLWVSTAGTDTATGTNLGVAKKTLTGAYAIAAKGDTINMVNDGTHAGTSVSVNVDSTHNGTNYTSDIGLHIRGCDVSGVSAMCTIAFTASQKLWVKFDDLSDYCWTEGMRFDYTSQLGINTSGMFPIILDGQAQRHRINDCECLLSTNIGSTVDATTNLTVPELPALAGSSSAHAGGMVEVYNNLLINCQMNIGGYSQGGTEAHHNVFMWGAVGLPGTRRPVNVLGGWAPTIQDFHHNSIVMEAYGTERIQQSAIDHAGTLNTSILAFHSNLVYVETGTGVTAFSNYIFEAAFSTAQVVSANTMGYNYIGLGPNLSAESSGANDWDTSTVTGIHEYVYNKAWREGGASGAGTNLNANDVFNRTITLASLFNDITLSYTWIPGSYSHDLPMDLRVTEGRTAAADGGVVGALDAVINNPPVVVAHTYTGTSGVLKTTNATFGVLAGSSDPDADTLTVELGGDVSHGVLVLNTTDGSFDYTPSITYVGTDTFTYKAWDGTTYSNVSTATINISNQTPTVNPRSYSTPEGTVLTVNATNGLLAGAADADPGQTLSVTSVVAPATGTLVSYNITTGSFVYRPGAFASGLDSFTFKVTDGGLLTDATTAAINVLPVSDPVGAAYIDTAPFFRPSLYVETEVRARWTKNRQKALNEANYTDGREWNESTSRSMVLTPSATATVNLGGIASAQYLFLETDYPIEVSIDGTDKYWPVTKALAVALTEYSSIALRSVSTTNAQVIMTMVD